jgi:hypothetical protein
MSGVYQEFGEIRQTALKMAIDSAEDFSTDAIVARAQSYFSFLTAGGADGKF